MYVSEESSECPNIANLFWLVWMKLNHSVVLSELVHGVIGAHCYSVDKGSQFLSEMHSRTVQLFVSADCKMIRPQRVLSVTKKEKSAFCSQQRPSWWKHLTVCSAQLLHCIALLCVSLKNGPPLACPYQLPLGPLNVAASDGWLRSSMCCLSANFTVMA